MKLNLQQFGGRGSSNPQGNILSPLSDGEKEALREKLKAARERAVDFAKSHSDRDGSMTESDARKYIELTKEIDELEYKLYRSMKPTLSGDKWQGEGNTEFTSDEAAIAVVDLLRNKDIYMAVKQAAHGTSFVIGGDTNNTPVDDLYEKNPDKTYKAFSGTRRMMRKKYGDTATLYRAGTEETGKATINMTTSRENAQKYAAEYGTRVTAVKVPISDILAVNVTRSGRYEEVIVINKNSRYSRKRGR